LYTRESDEEAAEPRKYEDVMTDKSDPQGHNRESALRNSKVVRYRVTVKHLVKALLQLADTGRIDPSLADILREGLGDG